MFLKELTAETIYQYGTYIFIFWVATFLVRKTWGMFEGRLKNIDENVTENKSLNKEILKIDKDISVIQAQIHKSIKDHNEYTVQMWENQLDAMDRLCQNLNGNNPKIKELMNEIEGLKKTIHG